MEALLIEHPAYFVALSALLGLIVGSFLNVVIYRLPKMALAETPDAQHDFSRFDLAFPASHCPHCKRSVVWRDNIPILSYLHLRGRCRECGQPISPRYPIIELICGLLFALVAWRFGFSASCLAGWLFVGFALCLSAIDLESFRLPDSLTLPLLWIGLAFNLSEVFVPLESAVIGAMAGYLSLWSLYWLFRLLTKKEGLGYGDFKLLAAVGAFAGWAALPMVLLCAAASALAAIVVRRIVFGVDLRRPLPFGPFLALGGFIVLLFGVDAFQPMTF